MVNISLFEHIESLFFPNVWIDVFEESIIRLEVQLLVFGGVA